ncbi:helix-turn-helix domain-containing protein [Clostridium sp. WILCCON 0269]|uniref:Helix-turn-helix domain-containing protein n=1 Tax=Candidatus Clostridium eludens TaxID=3381663 RepID=A0ABW8SQ85_9CLOT
MDNILGKRIRLLRTENGLTQEEFGKPYNLRKSTISQYESGFSKPDDELKKRIVNDFNVSLDWLMGLTDIRNPYIGNQNNKVEETQNIKKEPEKPKEILPENKKEKEPSDSDLATTQMVIDRLIEEGLLKDDKIDARIANMLLNSLKIDIELKLNEKKKNQSP